LDYNTAARVRQQCFSVTSKTNVEPWNKNNTVFIGLKLMKKSDADILAALDPNRPKQTQIKEWIRTALSIGERDSKEATGN